MITTQNNTIVKEEEINTCNHLVNQELDEDDLNNCFTLTQTKNKDGLTFTECTPEYRVLTIFYFYRDI